MQEGKSQYGAEDQGSEENGHSKYIPVVQISVCHTYFLSWRHYVVVEYWYYENVMCLHKLITTSSDSAV